MLEYISRSYTCLYETIRTGLLNKEFSVELRLVWSDSGKNTVFECIILLFYELLLVSDSIRRDLRRKPFRKWIVILACL